MLCQTSPGEGVETKKCLKVETTYNDIAKNCKRDDLNCYALRYIKY